MNKYYEVKWHNDLNGQDIFDNEGEWIGTEPDYSFNEFETLEEAKQFISMRYKEQVYTGFGLDALYEVTYDEKLGLLHTPIKD